MNDVIGSALSDVAPDGHTCRFRRRRRVRNLCLWIGAPIGVLSLVAYFWLRDTDPPDDRHALPNWTLPLDPQNPLARFQDWLEANPLPGGTVLRTVPGTLNPLSSPRFTRRRSAGAECARDFVEKVLSAQRGIWHPSAAWRHYPTIVASPFSELAARLDCVGAMRKLRCVEKNSTYLVTKKCNDDLFFLVPDPLTDLILMFSMLAFASKYQVVIHGFCFMSNHFHMVVTDCKGRLPDFMRELLCNSSKALKVHLGEERSIWSSKRYSAVKLLDLSTAERKLVYTILNPTRAELAAKPSDWPGVTSARWKAGDTMTAARPSVYFSPATHPDQVALPLVPLSASFDENKERSEARIKELLHEETLAIQRDMKARGATFASAAAVKRTPRTKRSTHPVSTLNPRFASNDKKLLKRAIAEDREFHRRHAEAKTRYLAGDHNVMFPAGTYWYRVLLGVKVERARRSA